MKTIEWKIYTGFVGATHEGEFEVEDDVTDTEIDEMVQNELWNHIEMIWDVVEKNEAPDQLEGTTSGLP